MRAVKRIDVVDSPLSTGHAQHTGTKEFDQKQRLETHELFIDGEPYDPADLGASGVPTTVPSYSIMTPHDTSAKEYAGRIYPFVLFYLDFYYGNSIGTPTLSFHDETDTMNDGFPIVCMMQTGNWIKRSQRSFVPAWYDLSRIHLLTVK